MEPLKTIGPRGYIHDIQDGARRVVGFGDAEFLVKEAPRREVVALIVANHYSHRAVNNAYVHLGVYHRGALVGALQLGYAMNPASARNIVAGTCNRGYLELNRMWLSDAVPRNGESMAIAYAVKYIRAAHPAVDWIQSFADERCGLWGVVYQACNFVYCGFHRSTFYELDGVWYHKILATSVTRQGGRGAHLRENLHRASCHVFRQFRYVLFLKRSARRRLLLPIHPYPKPDRDGNGALVGNSPLGMAA